MSRLNSSIHVNLTDSVINKLFNKGIYTYVNFINKETNLLIKDTGLSFKEIVDIKNEIANFLGGRIINNALDLLKSETIISSGVSSLDKLLDGGFHSNQIYEFCGASSSGKTQLCLSIATFIALETNKIVHYIDTKGDFSVLRVEQILNAKKCKDEEIVRVMENIKVTEVTSTNLLFSILHNLGNISLDKFDTKLLIIDSMSTFCLASNKNIESTYSLCNLRNMLRHIKWKYNISIITTNLITQWSEENAFISFKDGVNITVNVKPTLGKIWLQVPNTRILLKYLKNEEREISIWDSLELNVGEKCNVNINSTGVC